MKNVKRRNRLIAIVTAVILIVIASIPALAESVNGAKDAFTYEHTSGTTLNFTKYLVLEKDANIPPTAVFDFALTNASGTKGGEGTIPVYDGLDADKAVIFTSGTAPVASSKYSGSYSIAFPSGAQTTAGASDDGIANDANKKYAAQQVVIDFSGIAFSKPGVYRYHLNEQNTKGFNTDQEERTIDVYVEDTASSGTDTLRVSGIVMYKGSVTNAPVYISGTTTSGTSHPSGAEKNASFINKYPSSDLVVQKFVTGNQSDRSEFFDFRVDISNAVGNAQYEVDISNMVVESGTDGINSQLAAKQYIETDADGKGSLDFKLQHGQSIRIYGLNEGTFYTVRELNGEDLDKEGYSTKVTVTDNGASGTTPTAGSGSDTRIAYLNSGTGIYEVNTVTFTNTKNGVLPTGIDMKIIPVILAAVLFIGAISVLTVRMARKDEE